PNPAANLRGCVARPSYRAQRSHSALSLEQRCFRQAAATADRRATTQCRPLRPPQFLISTGESAGGFANRPLHRHNLSVKEQFLLRNRSTLSWRLWQVSRETRRFCRSGIFRQQDCWLLPLCAPTETESALTKQLT